jgi:nitrogen regulatory protein PII
VKLIVAYVRPHMAQATLEGLLEAGCPDALVHEGKRLVPGLRGEEYAFSIELGQRYEPMTILLFPAPEEAVDRWTKVIRRAARTGHHGDGDILVIPLDSMVSISVSAVDSTL